MTFVWFELNTFEYEVIDQLNIKIMIKKMMIKSSKFKYI